MPEKLISAIEERPCQTRPFAVFDFDNTVIVNDIGDAAFSYLCGHELLKDRTLLGERDDSADYFERVFHTNHALLKEEKRKAAYMLCMRMFSGFTPGEAEAATLAAITEEGKKLGSKMLYGMHIERGLQVRKSTLALVEHLRGKGVEIWIVSASPQPAVGAAMRHFGIEANLIGARAAVVEGVFTQDLIEPLSMFEGKAECIKKYISTERPLVAVGDTLSDLQMLEMADIGVVIEGRELAALAEGRGWFVL